MFKEEVIKLLTKITNLKKEEIARLIETPPSKELGDYSLPCFQLTNLYNKSPAEIAKELSKKIKSNLIEKIEAKGPYLNFFLNKKYLIKYILLKIKKQKERYGDGKKLNKLILIESPGPNTNKPLHLGHVRNMVLGNVLFNLYKKLGYKVKRVDIINDRGIHICKSMLAYEKYGKNKIPNKKPDHFVGYYYVLYEKKVKEKPELEKEIYDLLKKWEEKDPQVMQLWKKMNSWALKGFKETYERYGVKIDKTYFESEHYLKGKQVVLKALKKLIFKKDEQGNIYVDLSKYDLGKKIVLRADGTSIYTTQDIALAKIRYDEWKMDKMIYVVANEQIHHFNSLFKIFEILKFPFAKNCYHLAYGMIYLPKGKMKSREGNVVDADNIANEMQNMAKIELKKRNKNINKKELFYKSELIGISAIKFFMVKYDPLKDFIFDPNVSISFEGETGPYLQYTYARLCSILRKAKITHNTKFDYNLFTEKEIEIIKQLERFPHIIKISAEEYKPHLLIRYILDLAQLSNTFYVSHPILKEKENIKNTRLLLVESIKTVLKNGLNLLGITPLEKM